MADLTENLKDLEPLNKDEKTQKNDCEDFDEILEIVGTQGKFQKRMLYLILCPMTALMPFFTMNTIFMLYVPDHWCDVPRNVYNITGMNEAMIGIEEWKNFTIPLTNGTGDGLTKYDQCHMYDPFKKDGSLMKCNNGWVFDKTDYASTIPSTFGWVCDNVHYSTNAFTWSAVGNAVGTIIFGPAADKFGRKPIFYLTCYINILFRAISLFIPQHHTWFLVMMFLAGTAFPMMFISPSMINVESCDKEYRAWVYAVTWMTWVIGMSLLPFVVWLCSDWLTIGIVTTLPGLFFVFYYKAFSESPRWLVSVGRIKEAATIILNIAKVNGNADKITPERLDTLLNCLAEKKKKEAQGSKNIGIWTLFSRKRMAKNTIMLTISWSMNLLIYYGITLNTPNMNGNQFLNFFILSIIELPAGWLGGYLADQFGRRWLQVFFYFFASITCLVAAVVVRFPDLSLFVLGCIIVAKFAITLTNLIMYMQGTEIFPTQLRSTGTGFASTIGSTLGIMGPYIIFLGRFHVSGPYLVMGILGFIGLFVSAFLPETHRQNLPQTVEDANNFGKNVKFWSYKPKPQAK